MHPPGQRPPREGLSWSSQQNRNRVPRHAARSVPHMDTPLLIILLALAISLLLFALDVFPYPFGLIVLTLLAIGRFLHIRGPA